MGRVMDFILFFFLVFLSSSFARKNILPFLKSP